MNVYITRINGWSLKDRSHYIQRMTAETAHQLGCREMGIYRYPADGESSESLSSRLDGIIAGVNRGDLVICQFPTGNGLKFEKALTSRIRTYGGRTAVWVHELESLARPDSQSALQETIQLYNQAEVLIVPSYAMKNFLLDNGIRKSMKFVIQETWDYTADDRFLHAPAFRKEIHFTDGDSFEGMNGWNYSTQLKLYTKNAGQEQNLHNNVYNMGEMEPDQLFSELSKGGFGLVWYRDAYDKQYMKYGISFSAARYLAVGIPVIVPKGSSVCSIIEENHLGLTVNSLEEAARMVEAMEEAEYRKYAEHVERFAPALRNGYYTKKCLIDAMQAFFRQDAGRVLIPEESYYLEKSVFMSTDLHESYGGNLALSWDFKGKTDGFLICDASSGEILCDTKNVHQHYFLIKNRRAEDGFVVKAYIETLRGKLITVESERIYLRQRKYDVPKVSLIIPAYNAEKYIIRSINTALAQSLDELEIIIVDDGSMDHTPEILDWYAEKYVNVTVIHQENKGVAEARNTGIMQAGGEYIGFLDSDDMMRPNMMSRLYHSAEENDCDIAITSAYQINNNGYEVLIQYPMSEDTAVLTEDFLRMIIVYWGYTVVVWNKLYRASIVKKHLFPKIRHDDEVWTPYILSYADKICYLNDLSYEYDRIVPEGTLVDNWKKKSPEEQFSIYKEVVLFYLNNCNPKRRALLKELAIRRLAEKEQYLSYDGYRKLKEEIKETF